MNESPVAPDESAAHAALAHLRATCRSAILATINPDGSPNASYAPFAESGDSDGALLVFVSGLARHTENLMRTGQASVLLIEDESACGNVFARARATYACRAEPVDRESSVWRSGLDALQKRHGAAVNLVRDLPDFRLVRLIPQSGSLVLGFGRAWRLSGRGCGELQPVGPR